MRQSEKFIGTKSMLHTSTVAKIDCLLFRAYSCMYCVKCHIVIICLKLEHCCHQWLSKMVAHGVCCEVLDKHYIYIKKKLKSTSLIVKSKCKHGMHSGKGVPTLDAGISFLLQCMFFSSLTVQLKVSTKKGDSFFVFLFSKPIFCGSV